MSYCRRCLAQGDRAISARAFHQMRSGLYERKNVDAGAIYLIK
ncbi:MAG: hypothetical protein AB4352_10140 [Hormoscilla sp.]